MARTLAERLDFVEKSSVFSLNLMRPLKEGSLKNKVIGSAVTGYSIQLNNLSYRGIWVSTFEDIQLTVDGEPVPKHNMVFRLGALCIPIDDLGGHSEVFWGATDVVSLDVYQVGGLSAGEHHVAITIKRRNDFGHSVGDGSDGPYDPIPIDFLPLLITDDAVFVLPAER
ncbi:MAG: DUF6379 domain-containing protein [Bifidobacteriaceae bacterium]|jgi:hypothetical protein|nr:DUF6379 domain-containing protein [Bifidobacteriaceae bacterium]